MVTLTSDTYYSLYRTHKFDKSIYNHLPMLLISSSITRLLSVMSAIASSISFFTADSSSFDFSTAVALLMASLAPPPAFSTKKSATIANNTSDANAVRPPDSSHPGTNERAAPPASPAATKIESVTSPTPKLSPAAMIASVVASPTSNSSDPVTALEIVELSASNALEVDSNAAPTPDPSNEDEPISLAITPAPTVVVAVEVALEEARPNAAEPLATPLPTDVDAVAAAVVVVTPLVLDVEAVTATVPPTAAVRDAAAIEPPVTATLLPETAAVVDNVVPSDNTTAPPTAAAPTTAVAVALLSLATDAKKKGDSSSLLGSGFFCALSLDERHVDSGDLSEFENARQIGVCDVRNVRRKGRKSTIEEKRRKEEGE